MRLTLALITSTAALGIAAACSSSSQSGGREVPGSSSNDNSSGNSTTSQAASTTGGLIMTTSGGVGGTSSGCVGDECADAPPNCGDGALTSDEACDDANNVSGDGCAANCLVVEEGYSCNPPGQPCRLVAVCGDGIRAPSEGCDDGNPNPGDGCSATCKLEDGFKCDESVPNVCTTTTCGDGLKEGAESCDDGNDLPYDGCSANCRAEPDCSGEACASSCGDGLKLGEDCDDGNLIDGDGCSSTCTVEAGFMCEQQLTDLTDVVGGSRVLRVPVIYRDFTSAHPDFGTTKEGDGCDGWVEDIVATDLVGGKPVLSTNNAAHALACVTSFTDWYTDVPGTNVTIPGELILFEGTAGSFVNRHGANGEQFLTQANEETIDCNDGGRDAVNVPTSCGTTTPPRCTLDEHETCDGSSKTIPANYPLDGTPLFFPLDGHPDAMQPSTDSPAKIPEQYGHNGWPWERDESGPLHNFYFTTEVHYWFQYDATTTPTFAFTGDDDVWVFVNNKRMMDLGGIHVPISGEFTLDATTAGSLGLVDGNVYEISVFQAERRPEGSSFRLTLEGFSTARTECVPICGDSIISAGEACDDGVNDGGYGECAPGCVIGSYCGDGVVDEGFEDCDDGNRRNGDGCDSSCRVLEDPK